MEFKFSIPKYRQLDNNHFSILSGLYYIFSRFLIWKLLRYNTCSVPHVCIKSANGCCLTTSRGKVMGIHSIPSHFHFGNRIEMCKLVIFAWVGWCNHKSMECIESLPLEIHSALLDVNISYTCILSEFHILFSSWFFAYKMGVIDQQFANKIWEPVFVKDVEKMCHHVFILHGWLVAASSGTLTVISCQLFLLLVLMRNAFKKLSQ